MKGSCSLTLILALLLAGCNSGDSDPQTQTESPFVKTTEPRSPGARTLTLSGEVRARYETPVSFQVDGRIDSREVDDGDVVAQGDVLFRMDQRDLQENLLAAEAEKEAAESTLALASSDLERDKRLFRDQHVSQQTVDRTALREREARSGLNAAVARVEVARNALDYATLKSPADGVITEVNAEPGQVAGAGQPVAMVAHRGPRELELHFPEWVVAPEQGRVQTVADELIELSLREVSGALNRQSRTLRARYRIESDGDALRLGQLVRAEFGVDQAGDAGWRVPVSALDERGEGTHVWVYEDGQAQPLPVDVLMINRSEAEVRGDIDADTRIIAMGTHMLEPGMAVRELAQ